MKLRRGQLLAALLLTGCANLGIKTTENGVLLLQPSFGDGSYAGQNEVTPYSKDSINHLVIKLFTLNGEMETPVISGLGELSRDVQKAELDNTLRFSNLRAHTTYRIRGYAYKAEGTATADLISQESSFVDVVLETEERPTMAGIPVKLADRNFSGTGTSSISVTPGDYSYAFPEGFPSYYNAVYRIDTVAGGFLPENVPATLASICSPTDALMDSAGNLYIADMGNNRIRKVSPGGLISTVAGNGFAGFSGDGGLATEAWIRNPYGLAADGGGNLYIADMGNNRIRKVTPDGHISTVAGNGTEGDAGDGGPATEAQLNNPYRLAADGGGNLYIADFGNSRVRKVSIDGTITTVAGGGSNVVADGEAATNVGLEHISDVALDRDGKLLILEGNGRIHRVSEGTITTIAGNGMSGYSGDGGPAVSASLDAPTGIACDVGGNIIVSEGNHRVRKISADGIISTLAGTGDRGYEGDNGPALAARFDAPMGGTMDAAGNVYVADCGNHRIRKIATNGTISTYAGNGKDGYAGGYNGDGIAATSAWLKAPRSVLVRRNGEMLISDSGNGRIRKIGLDGKISTIAGNGIYGFSGDGQALEVMIQGGDMDEDAAGNFYFIDSTRIRKVSPTGLITTLAGQDYMGSSGDGGPASAALVNPFGIAVSPEGEVYIADSKKVRKIDKNGTITTFAGTGVRGNSGDGGPASAATFNMLRDVERDPSGNLYVLDWYSNVVRKIDKDGIITTVAGDGTRGYSGDGGPATAAKLSGPTRIATDTVGNLYILDFNNSCVRKVTPNGTISTIARWETWGYGGDNGPANSAQLFAPSDLTVDRLGIVYISDTCNNAIRKLD